MIVISAFRVGIPLTICIQRNKKRDPLATLIAQSKRDLRVKIIIRDNAKNSLYNIN